MSLRRRKRHKKRRRLGLFFISSFLALSIMGPVFGLYLIAHDSPLVVAPELVSHHEIGIHGLHIHRQGTMLWIASTQV